jgi:hypothetical protein
MTASATCRCCLFLDPEFVGRTPGTATISFTASAALAASSDDSRVTFNFGLVSDTQQEMAAPSRRLQQPQLHSSSCASNASDIFGRVRWNPETQLLPPFPPPPQLLLPLALTIAASHSTPSTIAAAERIPGAAKTVTVSFTIASALTSGQIVTITFPANYIASGTITATLTNWKTATTGILPQVIVEVDTAGVAAGSSHAIVLSGGTLGGRVAATTNGVNVVALLDLAATGTSVQLGGVVSNVAINIAAADRIPALNAKAVTFTFTTATRLSTGQSVTITLPSNYITGTIAAVGTNFATATTGTALPLQTSFPEQLR